MPDLVRLDSGIPITAAQLNLLADVANTKADLPGRPYAFAPGNWRTELQRMRSNIHPDVRSALVSGPWPVDGLSPRLGGRILIGDDFNTGNIYREVWFYFASATPSATVQCHCRWSYSTTDPRFLSGIIPPGITELVVKVRIGGDVPVRFQGGFLFRIRPAAGGAGGSVTSDFPAAPSFTLSPFVSTAIDQGLFTDMLDTTVNPGEYTFTATCTNGEFSVPYMSAHVFSSSNQFISISATRGEVQTAIGIHTSLPVWKIHASIPNATPDGPTYGMPFGLYGLSASGWITEGSEFLASIDGLWVARTQMISAIRNLTAHMPWNPLQSNNPYRGLPTGDLPFEQRTHPDADVQISWSALTTVGAKKWLAANGSYHIATNTGVTGINAPNWHPQNGGSTLDGSVIWRNFGTDPPVGTRLYSIPIYPHYRDTDSVSLKPSRFTYWSQFVAPSSQPYWFIYRVRLNRIVPEDHATPDQLTMSGANPLFPSINVELGCLRNGVFLSFGTWPTGDWVRVPTGEQDDDGQPITTPHVLWPIFTQDALVYRAAERVDVQAELCALPDQNTFGPAVGWPMVAAHYNDTLALLGLFQ